jgi:hypothetical protein
MTRTSRADELTEVSECTCRVSDPTSGRFAVAQRFSVAIQAVNMPGFGR